MPQARSEGLAAAIAGNSSCCVNMLLIQIWRKYRAEKIMNQGKTRFFFTTTVYIADFY